MASPTSARLAIAFQRVKQGQLAEAEIEVDAVLRLEPDNLSAQTLMAVLCMKQGQLEKSEQILATVLEREPRQVDALGILLVVRKERNNLPGAIEILERLIAAGQISADIYNQLGSCWFQLGDAVSAGRAFKRAVELDRTKAHSYYNLGMALKLAGNSVETYGTFRRAIELDPNFFDGYVQLWQQMRQLLNWRDGLSIIEQGLARFPSSAQMMVMAASTYGKAGQFTKAEKLFSEALKVDCTAGPPYAHWLQEEGRFEESIPVLEESIRLNPIQGQAYYNLAVAKRFDVGGQSLLELASPLLDNPLVSMEEQMFLHYALAKTHDDLKDYKQAMQSYDRANDHAYQLFNANVQHDAYAVDAEQETLATLYSRESIASLSHFGCPSNVPIFIVGMIRTGTTLLDQILASHPQIKSAGEQPFWQVTSGRVNRRWVEGGQTGDDLQEIASTYLGILLEATGGAERVTDKMPTNFMHMGLMSVAFPNAKFIHIRRNAVDTCLSIYTTFLGSGTQFAYNQDNIVSYYRAYLRTMEHWRRVIPPGQMIEIDYEDLVTNKEDVLRAVIRFCGLKWSDTLLSHHERKTTQVSTPSLYTARQPVNTASVERWRRYEPWLGRLLELKDVVHPKPEPAIGG